MNESVWLRYFSRCTYETIHQLMSMCSDVPHSVEDINLLLNLHHLYQIGGGTVQAWAGSSIPASKQIHDTFKLKMYSTFVFGSLYGPRWVCGRLLVKWPQICALEFRQHDTHEQCTMIGPGLSPVCDWRCHLSTWSRMSSSCSWNLSDCSLSSESQLLIWYCLTFDGGFLPCKHQAAISSNVFLVTPYNLVTMFISDGRHVQS